MFSSFYASVAVCLLIVDATILLAQDTRPNVVIILADDMGYGDSQCYQPNSKIPTPHLNLLAAGGIRFTDAHTPSSVCTPTRYSLLTGRYCWRTRLTSGVLDGFSPPLLEPDRLTLPLLLKSHGYATACIGKWHLGMQWTRTDGMPETEDRGANGFRPGDNIDFTKPISAGPLTCGFDTYFGISASLDMPPYCYIENDHCHPAPDTTVPTAKDTIFLNQAGGAAHSDFRLNQVLPTLKDRAVKWIRAQKAEQPLFLYLPLNSPHLPVSPSDNFRGRSGVGDYGDFVMETDDCVGAVTDALKQTGRLNNMLVIFTSDNGGLWHEWEPIETDDVAEYKPTPRAIYNREHGHRSNTHLRGTKADAWEGGHRVPFLVHWPAQITAGRVCEELIELTDVMATCADILQHRLPENAAEDSFSFLPALRQTSPMPQSPGTSRPFSVHHSLRGMFAIRLPPGPLLTDSPSWKLIEERGSGGFSMPRSIKATAGSPAAGQLYRLGSDPSETRNRYADEPATVEQLNHLLLNSKTTGLRLLQARSINPQK